MTSDDHHRFRAPRRWVLPALAATALAAHAASARNLTLTITPELPTWADSVRLRVSGQVETACGPSVMHLANVRKPAALGAQLLVEVDLVEDPCPLPPFTTPFAVEVELGHLLPGSTTVQVRDLAAGTLAQQDLLVYDVSRAGLDVPPVVTSGAAVKVGVNFYNNCSSIEPQVAGNVITLTYHDGCPILPPSPSLARAEVDVGLLAPGQYEVRLVEPFGNPAPALRRLPLRVWDAAGCLPFDASLCLHDGRFRVIANWWAFDGSLGSAHAAPLPGNEGSGLLWFFARDNAELTVKVLDACGVDGNWWVFLSSASTVQYQLTVIDTKTGLWRTYDNALGQVPELVADTDAFDCQ